MDPPVKNNMHKILFFSIVLLVLASCRSTRNIGTAVTKRDTAAPVVNVPEGKVNDSVAVMETLVSAVNKNKIDYNTFTGKVNVDYSGSDGKAYNLNANIRMYRDSAIWISANAILGIEALRVLVTKDSVKFLDKINKVYRERRLGYLQEVTELPLDLHTLQDLIIGNPVFLDSTVSYTASGNGLVTLLSIGPWFKNLLTLTEPDMALMCSKLDDADISRSRTADLSYSDYDTRKGPLFATKRRIFVSEKKTLDVKLDFKQFDFNTDVSFPFSVPKNYQID